MKSSLSRLIPEPVLLARKRCEHCYGEGSVPTPEYAAFNAKVERLKRDHLAEHGGSEQDGYARAEEVAGEAPKKPHFAGCKSCEGRGYDEVEVSLDKLADLLNGDKEAA